MADYLPTTLAPSPDALKARRLAAMLQQKEANTVEPIRSPWQGVGRIAQSIAGGLDQYQTDKAETTARQNASQKLAAALKGDDLGAAVGAMSDPWTNPEAAKTVAGILAPQRVDTGTGTVLVDRQGHQLSGSFIPKTINAPEEYGPGTKFNQFYQGTQGGGVAPLQPSNAPPVFNGNRMQGNITSNQGQPGAPPVGTVAQAPVGPTVQDKAALGNKIAADRKAAETTAESQAKYYNTKNQGITGTAGIMAQQKVNLDLLRQVADSPNFVPGEGSDTALKFQRLAARFNINPNAAAPREVFNQVAARVLADQFAGLKLLANQEGSEAGRIFAPMLEMEEKANFTPHDSLAGIKAKINILDKLGDKMMHWGDMADDYTSKHGRLDQNFDKMYRSEVANTRIPNAIPQGNSQDDMARSWAKANPNDPRAAKILQHLGQ